MSRNQNTVIVRLLDEVESVLDTLELEVNEEIAQRDANNNNNVVQNSISPNEFMNSLFVIRTQNCFRRLHTLSIRMGELLTTNNNVGQNSDSLLNENSMDMIHNLSLAVGHLFVSYINGEITTVYEPDNNTDDDTGANNNDDDDDDDDDGDDDDGADNNTNNNNESNNNTNADEPNNRTDDDNDGADNNDNSAGMVSGHYYNNNVEENNHAGNNRLSSFGLLNNLPALHALSALNLRSIASERSPRSQILFGRIQCNDVNMAILSSRLKTFEFWPLSIKQRPEELAEAGFYYNGRGDQVICFSCELALFNWMPSDDPWVEHARNITTKCEFMELMTSEEYIADCKKLPAPDYEKLKDQQSIDQRLQLNPKRPNDADDASNGDSDSFPNCRICLDNAAKVVFLPCAHISTCVRCSFAFLSCPMCRAPIERKIKTFY